MAEIGIAGELVPKTVAGVGMSAQYVLDKNLNKTQKEVNEEVAMKDETYSQYTMGLNGLKEYVGALDTSNSQPAILTNRLDGRYAVIRLTGGGSFTFKKDPDLGQCRFCVTKSFTYNPTTTEVLDLATGETGLVLTTSDNEITHELSSDARFLIVSLKSYAGTNQRPGKLVINGIDYFKNIHEVVSGIEESVEDLQDDANASVKTTEQCLTIEQKAQARNNIDACANIVYDVSRPSTFDTHGYYRYNNNNELYFASASSFSVSNLIPIAAGMEVVSNTTINAPYSTAKNVFFDSTATSPISRPVAVADLTNGKITITQAHIDAGYKYLGISFKLSDTSTPEIEVRKPIPIIASIVELQEKVNVLEEEQTITIDESDKVTLNGYYYHYDNGTIAVQTSSYFKASTMIPVQVGDTIVLGNFNPSMSMYPTVPTAHICYCVFNADNEPFAAVTIADGRLEITQEMWNSGVRGVGISFDNRNEYESLDKIVRIRRSVADEVENLREEVESIDVVSEEIEIKKYSSTIFKVYIPSGEGKRVCYIFEKQYKIWDSLSYVDSVDVQQTASDIVSADYWNNSFICINDGINNHSEGYIIQGNTNFIYKIPGANNHVGNGHGCERARYRRFMLDGKDLDIESMSNGESVYGKSFRYIQKSECYATDGTGNTYTTTYPKLDFSGNPIVDCIHYMDCLFELGNRVTINNSLEVKKNGLIFYDAEGAMLECDFGKFTHVYVNTTENTVNQVASDGTTTTVASAINLSTQPINKANVVEMYGVNHFVRQSVIATNPERQSKISVYSNFYDDRLKNYISPVIGTRRASDLGETAETFNQGDLISVVAKREIELS